MPAFISSNLPASGAFWHFAIQCLRKMAEDSKSSQWTGVFIGILLVGQLFSNQVAQAQTFTWSPVAGTTGLFGEAGNWSPTGPPGVGHTALFNFGPGNYTTVFFNTSPTNSSLQHQSGNTIFQAAPGTDASYSLTGNSTITGGTLTVNSVGGDELYLNFNTLSLSGNSTFTVNAGAVTSTGALNVGSGSAASMLVSGPNTSYVNTSTTQSTLGFSTGGFGTLEFNNGAMGSFAGSLRVGGAATTGGVLNVFGGSTLSVGTINAGNGTTVGQQAEIMVAGSGSTITQTGSSSLTLGKTSNGTAEINVHDGGIYHTGTGITTINATGSINIYGSSTFVPGYGQFNANGDVSLNGGSITRHVASITAGQFNLAAGRTLTATNGGQINLGHDAELSGGTTWNIQSGSSLTGSGSLNIGTNNGTTNVTIDDASLIVGTALSSWGGSGHTANVTVQNGGSASAGSISLGASGSGSHGSITVGAASTITQQGSSTLTVGGTNSTGSVQIDAGGVFHSGTGSIQIRGNSNLMIAGGIFNANGNVTVDSASLTRSSGSFNLASGRTFTASNGAHINLGSSTALSNGTTWNLQDGSHLFTSSFLDIAFSSGVYTTTLVVDNASLSTGSPLAFWGNGSATAAVTFRNGAIADVGTIRFSGVSSTLNIETGVLFSARNLEILGGSSGGTVNVSGGDSILHTITTSTIEKGLTLGQASTGTATLNVFDGGTVNAGPRGTRLRPTGTLNINGGFAYLGSLDQEGGVINFNSGFLSYGGNLTIGTGGLLGNGHLTLDNNKQLALTGTTTINAFRTLTLNGGTFSTGNLLIQNSGNFNFQAGTLVIAGESGLNIGSSGALGDSIDLGSQRAIEVTHEASISSDGLLSLNSGGRLSAGSIINHGEILLNGAGRIAANNTTSNYGLMSGSGRVDGNFVNATAGEVRVESGRTLNFTGSATNSGELALTGGSARFTTLENMTSGSIMGRGSLITSTLNNHGQVQLSGGFTDISGNVVAHTSSKIIVSGGSTTSFYRPVEVKDGGEVRVSDFSNGVFFDHLQLRNGAVFGGNGNVFIEGSLGIGNSPSRQEFSINMTFNSGSNLLVEIGGTNGLLPEYDQYVFLQNLTLLGGAMTVELISLNPGDPIFEPSLGDSFQIFEVIGTWAGTFGTLNLPQLSGSLQWDTSNLYSSGRLSVSAVPEPHSALLTTIVIAAFLGKRRR